MKRIFFLLLPLFLTTLASGEEPYYLKLRDGNHPESRRIVLEGPEALIAKSLVSQKGKDILISFPDASFTVQEDRVTVPHKIDNSLLIFSPGEFHKFKSFLLKSPGRLVIDIYAESTGRQNKTDINSPAKPEDKPQAESSRNRADPPGTQKSKNIIVLDPGHGGYEDGITSAEYKEKNVALDIAKMISALINHGETRCFLTRNSDLFMGLKSRADFTKSRNAGAFLSLHVGKHNNIILYTPVITEAYPEGIKTFLLNKGQEGFEAQSEALVKSMSQAIVEDFGNDMVSVKPAPYTILSKIEAAALIMELPSFDDTSYTQEFKIEIANTINKGLDLFGKGTAR